LRARSSDASIVDFRSDTTPVLATKAFARSHSNRARCVSRANFFSAKRRRAS
jgi:hypothetical protein